MRQEGSTSLGVNLSDLVYKRLVKEAAQKLPVSDYVDYSKYLLDIYNYVKDINKSFTHKKYAVALGFNPSNITIEYIKGRRPITAKTVPQISDNLALGGAERKYFNFLVKYQNAKNTGEQAKYQQKMLSYKSRLAPNELDDKTSRYMSGWVYSSIRELVRLQDFQNDPEWIRDRLSVRLRLDEIQDAIDLLLDLGFLIKNSKGELKQSEPSVSTGHRVKSLELRNYHSEMIDLGKVSLTTTPGPHRHIAGVTIPINSDDFDEINGMIQDLVDKVMQVSAKSQESDRVYQLNMQFFPITKLKKESNKDD